MAQQASISSFDLYFIGKNKVIFFIENYMSYEIISKQIFFRQISISYHHLTRFLFCNEFSWNPLSNEQNTYAHFCSLQWGFTVFNGCYATGKSWNFVWSHGNFIHLRRSWKVMEFCFIQKIMKFLEILRQLSPK